MTHLTRFAASRPRLLLVLACLALWLPGFFSLPPTDRDESRFVQATKQMLETGDYVRIMNGAVPRNRKPIGIYWAQAPFAAVARAAGVATENPVWPYRVPSLLGAMLAVLATHSLALRLTGNRGLALAAGGMLAGCVLLSTEAHIAKTDAALLGVTTLAMAMLARAWMGAGLRIRHVALFWLALGAGVLLKGPVTPMVVGLAVVALVAVRRRAGWLRALRPGWGVPLFLLVVVPWFAAIGLATHGAFFRDAMGGDLGRKLSSGEESHGGPPGLHLLLLPLLVFPATVPVICGLAGAWRRRAEPGVAFLLAWLVPGWLVFEAVPTKLPHYPLPLYPALMVLAALWLVRPDRRASRALAAAYVLLGLAAVVLAVGAVALPAQAHGALWLGVPAAVLAGVVFVCAWRLRVGLSLAACAVFYVAVLQVELPSLSALWIAPRAVAALRAAWPGWNPQGEGVFAVGFAEPSLMFLAGTRTQLMPWGTYAADVLAKSPGSAALVERHALPDFAAEAGKIGLRLHRAGDISGFNYSRGQQAELTLFLTEPK